MKSHFKIILLTLVFITACSKDDTPQIDVEVPVAFLNLLPGQGHLNFTIDDQSNSADIAFKEHSLFFNVPVGSKVLTIADENDQILLTQEVELKVENRYYFYLLRDADGELFLGTGENQIHKFVGSAPPVYRGLDFIQVSNNIPFSGISVINKSRSQSSGTGFFRLYLWFERITQNLAEFRSITGGACGVDPTGNELIFWDAEDLENVSVGYSFDEDDNKNELKIPSFGGRPELGPINTRFQDILIVTYDDPSQPDGYDGMIINWSEVDFINN